jgi:hypothetical protein
MSCSAAWVYPCRLNWSAARAKRVVRRGPSLHLSFAYFPLHVAGEFAGKTPAQRLEIFHDATPVVIHGSAADITPAISPALLRLPENRAAYTFNWTGGQKRIGRLLKITKMPIAQHSQPYRRYTTRRQNRRVCRERRKFELPICLCSGWSRS